MEFIDLARQMNRVRSSIDAGVAKVLSHGMFIMGPEVAELEARLAKFVGVKHCVSCANGTDALHMALMALGVGPGDAVFVPTFTFIATAEVVSLLGAVPIFVDVDARTFNLDCSSLEEAILRVNKAGTLTPKAIVPVDLFGLPADYQRIEAIAERYNLLILEDAAQSLGSASQEKKAGSFGHIAATSFFPAKPLGCCGDGGALFTNDDRLAGILKSIRVHGKGSDKYDNVRIGLNSRLDTLQAAILLAKLEVFPEELRARQRAAEFYTARLPASVTPPLVAPEARSAWAQYSILVEDRDSLQKALKEVGVPTNVYYPKPLHLQTAYSDLGYESGSFPVAERLSQSILSLPMHPYLTEEEQTCVVDAVARFTSESTAHRTTGAGISSS